MRTGVTGFQSGRLLQARLCRGLTQVALSTMVGKSSGTISKWEKGSQAPESDALDRLASCLGIPASWFLKKIPVYGNQVCFFRSTATITKEAQSIAQIRLEWLNELSIAIQHWIDWPIVNIPSIEKTDHRNISDTEIEQMASNVRKEWKLGLGPISDVVLALENAGVICVREELGFTKMDGASRWFNTDHRPYVFLAADKANGVRNRFDAAHELGHLVLHKSVNNLEFFKRYQELERQAHLFAGAFLLPGESFAAEVMQPNLDTFITLKPRWKISVAAMIVRCRQLGIIDDEYTTRLWKNYSARGWRKGEPLDDEIDFEPIRLLPRAVDLLISEGGLTKETVLSALELGPSDCEKLCGLSSGYFSQPSSASPLHMLRLKSANKQREICGFDNNKKSADIVQFRTKP
ncbi:ImmA/IrrE family metallo-endopeptidase [Nitrosomonas sp. Nm166]|uniref:helix-turn-helix domain-containing protein n=1 Tax=Nitrosomonas sp. Nm166 TaxID=1881054 RepID=UPI0008E74306|nr:ImmA/IrrE family metallo-endopeptidase [Nitrosomonas sp. Nm166]SFE66776.1 Zn-dependent peptidase ImmA, M78 family [Nitrosomonas sp. Nm166]